MVLSTRLAALRASKGPFHLLSKTHRRGGCAGTLGCHASLAVLCCAVVLLCLVVVPFQIERASVLPPNSRKRAKAEQARRRKRREKAERKGKKGKGKKEERKKKERKRMNDEQEKRW